MTKRTLAAVFPVLAVALARADEWPQWLGPQRDGVWRETGILEKFPTNGPTIRWRHEVAVGYAGPAVANGQVYITDFLAAKRSTNSPKGIIPGTERVFCLEEKNGNVLWQYEYDCSYTIAYPAGPRATPVIHDGKVYTLGAEGNLCCFDTQKGRVIWAHDFKKDYNIKAPMWGFAAHPLIDGKKLICLAGGEGSVAVAFDKDTGKEIWRELSAKEPGYCPPMIFEAGGKRQLIIWHPESMNSLDPETGTVYWSEPLAVRSGLTVPTPRKSGDLLFFTAFYNGSHMFKFDKDKPAVSKIWGTEKVSEKDTAHLNSIIPTPFIEDGYIYGVCSYGQLRCLKADTGERVWETFKATTDGNEMRWANAFIVKNGSRFFLFNEKGDLIIAKLTTAGYNEISRAHLLEPLNTMPGRNVVWSHPAFANRCIYARNDKEIVCANLALEK
jgi:outer membrane protein assembly factor BamB